MKNATFHFDIDITEQTDAAAYPFSPFVRIVLNSYSMTENDLIAVSEHLMSKKEIDDCVRRLKSDLDAVASRAKRKLEEAQGRILNYVR